MKPLVPILLTLCVLAGCRRTEVAPPYPERPPADMAYPTDPLSNARALLRQGAYQQAFLVYRRIMTSSPSSLEQTQAKVGVAQCLMKMELYAGVIGTLSPLPLSPASELDRQILGLAGEAMLRQGDSRGAESLLETALGDMYRSASTASWRAACCANLGYCYLKNDKPDKAAILYHRAADLFDRQGNRQAAEQAQAMADDLKGVIEQYRLEASR